MPVASDLEGGERNNYALSRSTSPAPSSARFFLLCFFSRVALCFVAVLGYPRFLPLAALVRSRGRFEAVRYRRYAFSTGACRLQSLLSGSLPGDRRREFGDCIGLVKGVGGNGGSLRPLCAVSSSQFPSWLLGQAYVPQD